MSNGINWNALTNLAQNRIQNGLMQSLQPPANLAPQPQLPLLGVIFVDGRSGVDAYPVPPNCQGVPLFDRETGELYIKSTDAYGNPTVAEFEAPKPKQSESDKQKAILVSMDERMSRLEAAIAGLVEGGGQNGKSYSRGNEQRQRGKNEPTNQSGANGE